jgi:hypothetical protein
MQAYKKLNMMLFEFFHSEKGLTHTQLLEYFLLAFMILSIMTIITLEIPIFYTHVWAKINIDLF